MKKITLQKKYIYMLFLLIICLSGFVISPTLAKFTSSYTTPDDAVGLSFDFNIGIKNIEEYEIVSVKGKEFLTFNVQITNNSSNTTYYGIWYKNASSSKIDGVTIARLEGTETTTSGSIDKNDTKVVTIIINNNNKEDIELYIGVSSNITSINDIEYLDGRKLISGTASNNGNAPKLDSGMIPVAYNEKDEVWTKADYTNADNTWYDYNNKVWANAVLTNNTTRENYQQAPIGTIIKDSDILAFYVWIPRYKYKVWNITRQVGPEDTYSYKAYTNGIEIEFENGTSSTGNVNCTYDISTKESETNLSDICIQQSSSPITSELSNSNYTNAWYTHPAFTFGGSEKTGFWIGKFETGGTENSPIIKPDVQSLRSQNVSSKFTTSKIFQSYGLSSNIDAHMLTNLEWGAVAYFTHSNYGLCNENNCRDIYINNSSNFYTGRSGGALAGDDNLQLVNIYGNKITTEKNKYNETGYYDYKGYFIDYEGNITTKKDTTKIASTTGNIYGVYDISGGSDECVMGNIVDEADNLYLSDAGTNWNKSSSLDNRYYNSYSYGINSNGQIAYNRSRLGDAIGENIGTNAISKTASWKPGVAITGSASDIINEEFTWFNRGGTAIQQYSSSFSFTKSKGAADNDVSFRSSLS